MKCWFTGKRGDQGIALVITLVMLAIVTVMAIVFLAVTRRERASVIVAEETAGAKDMADAALERAKTEAVAGMNASGSKLSYDLFNSQVFANPNGFDSSKGNSQANVAPVHQWASLRQGSDQNYLRMLANLQYDPPVPVFIETNSATGAGEFRTYLDLNRNRRFETNGFLFDLDQNGNPIAETNNGVVVTNLHRFVGDPEWIGVLERPDLPHSETNRFVGRMAYLVLPAGKSLDLNYIHNHADRNATPQLDQANARNGFTRNQGVGSWEINLAGFFRGLNTNNYAWHGQSYRFRLAPNQPPTGESFDDARRVLAFRYTRNEYLKPASFTLGPANLLNPNNQTVFAVNRVDDYGDGPYLYAGEPVFRPPGTFPLDIDNPDRPWPGSVNTNAFTDIQNLFSVSGISNRLQYPMIAGNSSYDRYTFYRLASQLGTDSTPATKGRLHLNYENAVGQITNTFRPWTNALQFFTNAADLMLKASIEDIVRITNHQQRLAYGREYGTYYLIGDTLVRTNFSLTNMQVYSTTFLPLSRQNEYNSAIHRILQVAANIYDNMTNRGVRFPYYPTVFVPIFTNTVTNIYITGFVEATSINSRTLLNRDWILPEAFFTGSPSSSITNYNLYGQHMVIGAKKGHPNFNELAVENYVDVSRKLALVKRDFTSTNMLATNQLFLVNMSQRFGVEAWNSYTNAYTNRTVRIDVDMFTRTALRDGTNLALVPVFQTNFATLTTTNITDWAGDNRTRLGFAPTNFLVALDTAKLLLRDQGYSTNRVPRFTPTNIANFGPLEAPPQFVLYTTNSLSFSMFDDAAGRFVDAVSFDNVVTVMDISTNLYSVPSRFNQSVGGTRGGRGSTAGLSDAEIENLLWDPTPVSPGSPVTRGLTNQLAVSAGELEVSDRLWRAYRYNSPDKRGSISKFRSFIGLPLRTGIDTNVPPSPVELVQQAPFTPTRQMHQLVTFQVNDPLVHYMVEDLRRRPGSDKPQNLPAGTQLPPWNIGQLNDIYNPWGGHPFRQQGAQDPFSYNIGLQDPGIRRSDDWEFPIPQGYDIPRLTNYYYPNIGTLGQVHRGTPWQTIYLKSVYQRDPGSGQIVLTPDPSVWWQWAGSAGTYPSSDWPLLDVFTTAPNENAARGLLSVNQTNVAAWSAVLSGVAVPTNYIRTSQLQGMGEHEAINPTNAYRALLIEPGTTQIDSIVRSIIDARTNQFRIVRNPNLRANPQAVYVAFSKTNSIAQQRLSVFENMGDILAAPGLSLQNPYLNRHPMQLQKVLNDRAVEYIPQQIMSLLQRDEPRFVVYAFGQSLKPAPGSLTSDPSFYHMCTNYQITGEVITKTTFRVEGELRNQNQPLRAVVESYQILPPAE